MTDKPTKTREQWDQDVLEFAACQEWADSEIEQLTKLIDPLADRLLMVKKTFHEIEQRIKGRALEHYLETGDTPHNRLEVREVTKFVYDRPMVVKALTEWKQERQARINSLVSMFIPLPSWDNEGEDEFDEKVSITYRGETVEIPHTLVSAAVSAYLNANDPHEQALRIKPDMDVKKTEALFNAGELDDLPSLGFMPDHVVALSRRDMSELLTDPSRVGVDDLKRSLAERVDEALRIAAEEKAAKLAEKFSEDDPDAN